MYCRLCIKDYILSIRHRMYFVKDLIKIKDDCAVNF